MAKDDRDRVADPDAGSIPGELPVPDADEVDEALAHELAARDVLYSSSVDPRRTAWNTFHDLVRPPTPL